MKEYIKALDRGEVTTFSRNSYEIVFSVFMIALAWFYRSSPQIEYPRILYFFLALFISNFFFNYLLRRRASVNVWLVELIFLVNFWIITGVIWNSGRGESYFWVLYLLPVFSAALMAAFKDAAGVTALCGIAITVMSWPFAELADLLSLAVKLGVLAFSGGIVYRTARARKRAEATLELKRAEAEQLSREIDEKEVEIVKTASAGEVGTLVSGVLHDLGNAVSVILLSAQVMEGAEKPEKKDLERVTRAARYAKGLLGGALSIVRGQDYVFAPGSLKEAAESAAVLTDYSARKKSATVELNIPGELPALLMSRVHIERVFINAISNSLSFVPEGGRVTVTARAAEGGVEAEITDNGPGFPEKILKEGVKAFGTTRKDKGGTGLGLFVCDQIARRHGGSLALDNMPGGGARIKLFLPLGGPNPQ